MIDLRAEQLKSGSGEAQSAAEEKFAVLSWTQQVSKQFNKFRESKLSKHTSGSIFKERQLYND